jgi:hypothetical protein
MKKTSSEAYLHLFCKWQRSRMSKAAFADREGLPKVSFYYWCKKFDLKPDTLERRTDFTRIDLSQTASSSAVAKINYPNGVSLELFGFLDTDRIKALVF